MTALFAAPARDLIAGITAALASLPGRPQPAIMGAMVIDADDDGVTFATYDWDKSTRARIFATAIEPGRVAVSGKLLAQVAKVMPKQPVTAEVVGSALSVLAGRTKFTLPLMPITEYPTIPAVDEIIGDVVGDVFVDAVSRVARSAAKESSARTVKGCVSIVSDGASLTLTALDGPSLASVELPWKPVEGAVVDVRIAADEILTALKPMSDSDTISVRRSSRSTLFGFSASTGLTYVTSTVSIFDGPYPQWRGLFADSYSTVVEVSAEFIAAAKRVAAVTESTAVVAFTEDGATITVDGAIVDHVEIDGFDGQPREFHVGPARLLDSLQSVPGTGRLRLGFVSETLGPPRPMALHEYVGGDLIAGPVPEPVGYRALLMGIRS